MSSVKLIEDLAGAIFEIEKHLEALHSAYSENQIKGELVQRKIKNFSSSGAEIPPELNDDMKSVIYLREWQLFYLERYEKFLMEAKSIYLEYDEIKSKTSFFVERKKKKILVDAENCVSLGRMYISTLSEFFDSKYSQLTGGEYMKSEALKLMSKRLASASKSRGDEKLTR